MSFSITLDTLLNNLATTGRGRKQVLSGTVDAALMILCLWAAYSLRHGQMFTDFGSVWHLFLLLPAVTVASFAALGIYRWSVRSTNRVLSRQLIKGAVASALWLVLIAFLLPPDRITPRSLCVIYALLLGLSTVSVRTIWQSLFDAGRKGEPVAIYGAGSSGQQLDMLLGSAADFRPVMFIDDDIDRTGSRVAGKPVISGSKADLRSELLRRDVSTVILAIPSLSRQGFDAKLSQFDAIGLSLKTMPSVQDMVSGTYRPGEVRDVSINDILGRREVEPDLSVIGRRVSGRSVLVTGGGGSIGSELVRQIANLVPDRLVVLDSCEENLYEITEEMNSHPKLARAQFIPCLGSVRDRDRLERLMRVYAIDSVFHAAAYKHVPIIEAYPEEGVLTNVFGTLTLIEKAIEEGVSDFVLISTDKAVRPTNAMGATKRAAELILQAKARESHNTRISMVRFGNVLGSSGSVVPKFKRQILSGGPVTVTHRDIMRYFMTIPEAAQLVLQASSIARGGDVFVLDMGEPVRIIDLARTMIRLFGRTVRDADNPNGDISIAEEGLRPGEKMYEELFLTDSHTSTSVAKVFTADEAWISAASLDSHLARIRASLDTGDAAKIKERLMQLANAAGTTDKAHTAVVPLCEPAANQTKVEVRTPAVVT